MIRTLGTEFVHFYLVEQDGQLTLVDAGVSGYRDTLGPALAEVGRSIDDVKAVVLTHADPDHVGFAGELHRTRGIPVYVHRADSERTREGKTKKTEGRRWRSSRCSSTHRGAVRCATWSPTERQSSPRCRR